MLSIQTKLIIFNHTSAPGRQIEYIVVHDTGNRSAGANAMGHYKYFNGGDRQSSADFFVDDNNIIQIVDYKNNYSWAVGDGHGMYGITNRNSVSVEICINSDGNYDKAVANAQDLVIYLMKELGLGLDKVVRHYECSHKNCPQSMNNNGDWTAWTNFKNTVAAKIKAMEVKKVKNIVVYNNAIDKRAAEYLADFLGCATLDGSLNFDYSTVENIYGVGGGTFPANAKVVKGESRYDTIIAVLKQIGKL